MTDEQWREVRSSVIQYAQNRKVYAEPADTRIAASLFHFGADNAERREHLEQNSAAMKAANKDVSRVLLESAARNLARRGHAKITRSLLAADMRMPERTFYATFPRRVVDEAIAWAYGQHGGGQPEENPVEKLVSALIAIERKGSKFAPDSEEALADYLGLTAKQFADEYGEHVNEARNEFEALFWAERCPSRQGDKAELANLSHRFAKGF